MYKCVLFTIQISSAILLHDAIAWLCMCDVVCDVTVIIIVGPLSMRIGINSLLPCMGANNVIVALM